MKTQTRARNKGTKAKRKVKQFHGQRLKAEEDVLMFIDPTCKDLIVPDSGNRLEKNNRNQIERLKKSMKKNGYVKDFPIIVGKNGMIKAGHHRFRAANELGIGVWIKINDEFDLKEISRMEALQKKWSTMDWIRKHANEGTGDYPEILRFCNLYGFGVTVNIMILIDTISDSNQTKYDVIADGDFKIKDWEKAHYQANCIKSFAPYFPKEKDCHNTPFASAVIHCLRVKGYNHDDMIRKVEMQQRKLRLQRTRRDNIEMLQEIYNYNRLSHTKLQFVKI